MYKKINLCCGNMKIEGFDGLDIINNSNVKYVIDLNKEKLPFENKSIDEFYEQNSFYELENPMNVIEECWRCLKPGGKLKFKEMYFSSQYAFTPLTKNFWNFSTARLFTKGYRYFGKWKILNIDFEKSFFPPKWLVNFNRNVYEKYFSHIFPINYIIFELEKIGDLK